jgi:hypothetical protein
MRPLKDDFDRAARRSLISIDPTLIDDSIEGEEAIAVETETHGVAFRIIACKGKSTLHDPMLTILRAEERTDVNDAFEPSGSIMIVRRFIKTLIVSDDEYGPLSKIIDEKDFGKLVAVASACLASVDRTVIGTKPAILALAWKLLSDAVRKGMQSQFDLAPVEILCAWPLDENVRFGDDRLTGADPRTLLIEALVPHHANLERIRAHGYFKLRRSQLMDFLRGFGESSIPSAHERVEIAWILADIAKKHVGDPRLDHPAWKLIAGRPNRRTNQ